jgi:CPA2 family monovalent cation:H+ antiporter-2
MLSCVVGALVAGRDLRTSVHVGTGMAQIGEFSFIIASLGLSLKVTGEFLYPVAVAVSAITTLTTPYLIRSTGLVTDKIELWVPKPLLGFLDVYSRWLGGLGGRSAPGPASRMIRKWTVQMILNLLLIGGIFLTAAFLGSRDFEWMPGILKAEAIYRTLMWLVAVIVSMPLFIATFRKLQALGMLVSELKITRAAAGERTTALRSIVSNAISFAGLAAMVIYGLSLSTTLLPPARFVVLVLVVVPLLVFLLWRSSIRIYSKAQVALQETLAQPAVHHDHHAEAPQPAALPSLLKEADLETVAVAEKSAAARKLIREIALRTRSGASIVGIERAGSAIINPGPDEELLAGDTVLLIGNQAQLRSAREIFTEAAVAA